MLLFIRSRCGGVLRDRRTTSTTPTGRPGFGAPKSCGLDDSYKDQIMNFEITDVQFFEFNQSNYHDYEVGVNIRVEVFDSFRRLERDYEDLEDVQFIGR